METSISFKIRDSIAEIAAELPHEVTRLKTQKGKGFAVGAAAEGSIIYLPLEPAGYPISPDDLDFGSGNPTAAQINNASRFSQLMNQIPSPGQKAWFTSGEVVWNVWEIVLDSMQLPAGGSMKTLQQLKANFVMEKRADMQGDIYYETNYSPVGFWNSTFDSHWRSFSYSPEAASSHEIMSACTASDGVRDLEFDPTGMNFNAEVILVTLLRPWLSPWLFSSTAWRFAPGSIAPPLSNGLSPPQGVMTMYPNAFLVARNVHLDLEMSRPKNAALSGQLEQAHALTWSAFQMKGASPASSPFGSVADLKLTDDGLRSNGLQILGFSCSLLPKCPNQDPNQQWP